MIFMMPIPPTISEMEPMLPSSTENISVASVTISTISVWFWIVKSAV